MWISLLNAYHIVPSHIPIPIMLFFLKFVFFLLPILFFPQCSNGRIFTFKMHHRFSDSLKNWSHSAYNHFPLGNWLSKGSFEYYAELAHRDQILRGRKLANVDAPLAFSDGNSTFRISSLGLYVSFNSWIGFSLLLFVFVLHFFIQLFFTWGVVCITRRWSWGRRESSLWWRLIRAVICFGCLVIAANVRLLRAPLMLLYGFPTNFFGLCEFC